MDSTEISILLVEDNAGDARLIRELLKETGYAGASLQHVQSLREAAQNGGGEREPHCVLADLDLPDGEGMASLNRVRELYPGSAVVVLTGMADDAMAIEALQRGAQNYINKNELTARELGRVLRSSIDRHEFVARLREADRAMVLRERRFRALVERSNDLTLLVDHSGCVTYMSPMAAQTLLETEVDADPLHLISLVEVGDKKTVEQCLQLALSRPEVPQPMVVRARPKRENMDVWVEGTLTNLLDVPGVNAVVVNLHDVTLRHHWEQELYSANNDLERRVEERTAELRRAEDDLREALQAERKINELKTRFVSTASHEFRTPLTAIKSSADLIARYNAENGHEKVGVHVGRIREKVVDLINILDEFLSLEKLEKGVEKCVPEDFDVVCLCAGVVEEMQALAHAGQLIVLDAVDPVLMVRLDRSMLANVLRNLLSNAIKYSPEGSVIELRCMHADGRLHLLVTDEGSGIPVEDQQHLFGRFFRASNAVATQGTGLGLHIVRRYLETMQGNISFTSVLNAGTTFTIDLPRYLGGDHL